MPTRNVTTIPATMTRFTNTPLVSMKKRRTAGYARVSTDHEEQQSSYEAQVDYYTHYIKSRDDWEFVKIYTDEGISATNTKHREGFNSMIKDALDGKIDLIITNIILPYLIQSHLWVQSPKVLDIWAFRDFVIFGTGVSLHKMTRCRLNLGQGCAKGVQGCAFFKK